MGTAPTEIARLSPDRAYDILLDFVGHEEKRGLAGSAIAVYVKAVRSWLAFRGMRIDRRIKIKGANQTPTLANEQVPDQETVRRILLAASTQQRVAVSLVAFSGVRLEVIGNFLGTDGLRIRDLPDVQVKKKEVRFESIPARLVVRSELSKTGKQYFTFLGKEGADYVAAYLEERLRNGEKLGPDSDVFHPLANSKRFVRTTNVGDAIRTAIRRAGSSFRPYTLRAYFDTQLLLAESKGKLARDYRVFWMGHTGSMESRYTTHKGRLPRELIDDMVATYHRCEPFLTTTPAPASNEEVYRTILEMNGVDPAEIDKLGTLTGQVVLDRLKKVRESELGADAPVSPGQQKVVDATAVEAWIENGWRFVSPLNGSKAVIESPRE